MGGCNIQARVHHYALPPCLPAVAVIEYHINSRSVLLKAIPVCSVSFIPSIPLYRSRIHTKTGITHLKAGFYH
jgi:hypothetical protein